jgi:uncharacterized protein
VSTIVVMAKAPVPGRVKTRLSPPWSRAQAAALAEAALVDTLDAVAAAQCHHRVVALEGAAGFWLPAGFDVVAQCPGSLGARLTGAMAACAPPTLLIGMDTPQVTAAMLDAAVGQLARADCDAVLGPAFDGGYWTIGLRRRVPGVFDGVPMSTSSTFRAQRRRLEQLGLRTTILLGLRDVDEHADAVAVARDAPTSHFGSALRHLTPVGYP